MKRRIERGSALVVSVVVVLIVSMLSVGLIRLATLETAGATAGAKREALSQCAEAAAHLLLSKFHVLGVTPTEINALNAPLDGTSGVVWAVGGHLDSVTSGVADVSIAQVTPMAAKATGPAKTQADDSNTIHGTATLGGQGGGAGGGVRAVVHCQMNPTPGDPASGRQLEVELGIVFGQ